MNEIDYKEAIEDLIKIEEASKEKVKFQETYLNQLKRRLKIYNKGRLDVLKELYKKIIKFQNEMENENPLRFNTAEEIRLIILEEIKQIEENGSTN